MSSDASASLSVENGVFSFNGGLLSRCLEMRDRRLRGEARIETARVLPRHYDERRE